MIWLIFIFSVISRFYQLSSIPLGPYSDEVAYGYNAYSLLKTGRDEWGARWPLTFKSFGDYKPPATAYLTVPSIATFGLNELGIRFPAALFGSLTVILIYFLAKEIFKTETIALLAAALLAISPWHIHFSRMSMLVGIENFFLTLGLLAFLKFRQNPRWLYLSATAFTAAIYTYYGARLTVPLLILTISLIFYRQLLGQIRIVLFSAILGLLLLSPLILATIKNPDTLTGRAKYMSVFYNDNVRSQLWEAHTLDGLNFPSLLSRFFHNKAYFYFRDVTRRYLSHFSLSFLAIRGDYQPPFVIANMGQLYLIDVLFFFIGLFYAVFSRSHPVWLLLAFLAFSPISSSFSFITPAANRSFNLVTGWAILTALGIVKLYQKIRFRLKPIFVLVCCLVYLISFSYFVYQYVVVTPQDLPHHFYAATHQMVKSLSQLESAYDRVVISGSGAPAYIYVLAYKNYPPKNYWLTRRVNPMIDELGWLHIDGFDKYDIPRYFNWGTQEKQADVLYVGFEEEIPDGWNEPVSDTDRVHRWRAVNDAKIFYPNGRIAYKLVHLEKIFQP